MNVFQNTESGRGELKNDYAEEDPSVADELAQRRRRLARTLLGLQTDEEEDEK